MGVFRALAGTGLAVFAERFVARFVAVVVVVIVAQSAGCTVDERGLTGVAISDADGAVDGPYIDGGPQEQIDSGAAADGAADLAREDAVGDSGSEAGPDAAPEVGADVAAEARPDVQPDVAPDARGDTPVDVAIDRAPEVAADVPVDRPVDAAVDQAVDRRPTCTGTQHPCGEVCADNGSVATCGGSCTPCAVPANGAATCNGVSCGIACDPNFVPSGTTTCVRGCTPSCEGGAVTVTAPGRRITGITAGASTASGSCGGTSAPEAVFRIVVTATSDLFVATHGTSFDTVIYLRNGCCGTELACNDNADGRRTSVLSRTGLAPGTYDLFIDGATAADGGAFTVDIFLAAASVAGDTCARPLRLGSAPVTGTTCGFTDNGLPQNGCQSPADRSGSDVIYYFVLDQPTHVSVDTCTGTCFDSVLYLRDVCTVPTTQVACQDDSCFASGCNEDVGMQSQISGDLAAGIHYVFVDTYPDLACGTYQVTPAGIPP